MSLSKNKIKQKAHNNISGLVGMRGIASQPPYNQVTNTGNFLSLRGLTFLSKTVSSKKMSESVMCIKKVKASGGGGEYLHACHSGGRGR